MSRFLLRSAKSSGVASAFFFTAIKDRLFKKGTHAAESFDKWELPGLIVLSLFLQFVLAIFGSWRKSRGSTTLLSLTHWFADWVANVALSVLFDQKETKERGGEIIVLWTSFLLLHLGGPDSISTNSSDSDNALGKKYIAGLSIQVGIAVYVFIRFHKNSTLTYIVIPLFVVGIIKYAERIWILWAASWEHFSSSIIKPARLSHKQMADSSVIQPKIETLDEYLLGKGVIDKEGINGNGVIDKEGICIQKAFSLYRMSITLFSDFKLRIGKALAKIIIQWSMSFEDAFKLVGIELGFLYDELYTKTTALHSAFGIILRNVCLLTTSLTLIAFSIIVGRSGYPKVDIAITYMLLSGAIFLDVYSTILHVLSNWTKLLLTTPNNKVTKFIGSGIVCWLVRSRAEKGIASLGQFSLIDYSFKAQTSWWARAKIVRALDNEDNLAKFWWTTWEPVNLDLKNFIHSRLQMMSREYEQHGFQYHQLSHLLKSRGFNVLKSNHVYWEEITSTIKDVEFSDSLLLWHIATFILFHEDQKIILRPHLGSCCQISKLLSDYMMYLLLVQPLMIPKGISEVRIRQTQDELLNLFGKQTSLTRNEVTSTLLKLSQPNAPFFASELMKLGRTKSVMLEGCNLACHLQAFVEESQWNPAKKWEMMADVWMEMLAFAARKSKWKEHAAQLRHGQELLTHVALLMAHLGLTKQIQIVDQIQIIEQVRSLAWDWEHFSDLPYYLA